MVSSAIVRRWWIAAVVLARLSAASGSSKSRLPLKEDIDDDIHQLKPGCIFGTEFYDLEQKWHPVLDSEVMYCTQCTCNPNVVKGQVQQSGSVSCKRIANECPDVSKCNETPVLPPNGCCKVCPDHGEYYALLTGSFSSDALSDGVAVVHMSLQKTVMHITVDMTRNVEPRTVRILDEQRGRVLFEHHVSRDGSIARVCAVWLSAFEHLGALRTARRLSVVLATRAHPAGELKGIVERLPMTSTAQSPFLGLLMAPSLAGYGGVVWLGVTNSADRPQMHIHGAVDIASDSGSAGTLVVELLRDEAPFEKVVVAMHPESQRHKFTHVSQEVPRHTLKRLSQGRVSIAVQTKTGRRLYATLKAWHPCGSLQALLSSMDATTPQEPGSAGLAKVTLLENGSMSYQVHLHKFDRKVASVLAETVRLSGTSGRATKLPIDSSSNSSLVTGTHEFADARELQLFVEGRVFLAVEVREHSGSALRGQLQLISHGLITSKDNVETILLTSPKSALSAAAVCGTTRDCLLFCKTIVPAHAHGANFTADVYIESQKHKNHVATYDSGTTVAASLMSQRDLKEMATLRPTIRVFAKGLNATAQITLPQTCSAGRMREIEDSPIADDSMIGSAASTAKSGAAVVPELGCLHNGHLYEDGDTWRPSAGDSRHPHDGECSTCSCKRNQIECHRELCPQWSCAQPVRLPGECCPVCNSTSSLAGGGLSALVIPALATTRQCYFPGDKRHHTVGTVWHPYIHPLGYFACAVCFCSADGSSYDCKQVVCPALPCPQHVAERRNESDCCKVCPARWYQGSSLMPAATSGTGLVPEASVTGGGGGGSGGAGGPVGGGESCVSTPGSRAASAERLHKKPGAAGSLECLLCACADNVMSCTKVKCNCRRQPNNQSDCCRKLCTLSPQGPMQAAERKLRRLAAISAPLQSGAA